MEVQCKETKLLSEHVERKFKKELVNWMGKCIMDCNETTLETGKDNRTIPSTSVPVPILVCNQSLFCQTEII